MKKFIVVGTQRTGSSAVAESIGLHRLVTCGWEWTLGVPRRLKLAVVESGLNQEFSALGEADRAHLAGIHHSEKEWIGFRWLFSSSDKWAVHPRFAPALWLDGLERFIAWAQRRPDIHIIHVVRRNNLDWLKSIYLAKKAKLYSKKQYPEGLKVQIPLRAAVRRVRAKNWVDGRLRALRHTNPYLCVAYEAFLKDPEKVTLTVLTFLNCPPQAVNWQARRLHKQSSGAVSRYLTNLAELQESLRKQGLLALEEGQVEVSQSSRASADHKVDAARPDAVQK